MTTTMTTPETRTFTIPAHAVEPMHERIAAFNALAAKHGVDARVAATHTLRTETRKDDLGLEYTVTFADVELTGATLVLPGGYELAAVLDLDAAGNIFRVNPHFTGGEIPAELRTIDGTRCDLCNAKRHRKVSVVVHSETEGFKVVGSDCVRVFLGIDPGWVVRLETELGALVDELKTVRPEVPVGAYVALAALVTTVWGFTPKSAHGLSTATVVDTLMRGVGKDARKEFTDILDAPATLKDRASALAAEALGWIAANTETSDYITNLRIAAAREDVGRNGGLLASLPNAYKRATEAEVKRAADAAKPVNDEFIGTVGAKVEFAGRVVFTNRSEPYAYNGPESLFATIVTETGETVWVTTTVATAIGAALEDASKDEVLKFAGTVKDHRFNRKGGKVTVMTRVKVVK